LLADVPLISSEDIRLALGALPERGLVICPSHDNGTSLLAMRPAGLVPFRFGPKSFSLHKREAAARGVPAEVMRIDSLARDIDTPDDLRALASQEGGTTTHRLLERLRILEGPDGRVA
jgi:2-phospho-L-lactate guanylyltransferase